MNDELLDSFTVPIEVFNEASGKYANQHWTKKNRRHWIQAHQVKEHLQKITKYQGMPITIKLIRISPRTLDAEDNLRYAFKWVKDAIADMLIPGLHPGRADNSKLIVWDYDQEKGTVWEKKMRVEVYSND